MAPKNKQAATDVAANGGSGPAPEAQADDGVKPAPYDATWINVAMAAKRADVTTQTVRNAYLEHSAFKPTVDGNERPAFFTTKMVDTFGNVTAYDVVYLDVNAVDAWIAARAEKAATGTATRGGKHDGAKRRVMRITDAQYDAQIAAGVKMDVDGKTVAAVALADGTLVALEIPTGNVPKKHKPAEAPTDGTAPANGVEVTSADAEAAHDAGAGLFDVELTEAPAV